MSASPWNLKIAVPVIKKSAKDALFLIGKKVLKTVNAKEEHNFGIYKYNIVHKMAEEIEKLTEETAQTVLADIKKELQEW